MRLLRLSQVPVLVLTLMLAMPHASAGAPSTPSDQTLERIASYAGEQLTSAGLPGGSVAVVSGGAVVLAKGFGTTGFSSDVKASAETLYAVASVTKTMTATAVLQLRERGLIDLDAPVSRYLPWFRVGAGPASGQITVRQLLNHTSGIPANAHRVVWQNPATIRGSLEAGVRALQGIELRHAPGEAFAYANMNYAVLGLMVERVSGQSWGAYLQTHIFDPLGMEHTTTELSRARELGLAQAHSPEFGRLVPALFDSGEFYAPSYRVFSSARDMAAYASALMDGRLIRPDTLKEAYQDAVRMDSGAGYGLGWMVEERGGSPVVFHGGDGSHSADLYLLPDRRQAVVLLVGAYSPARKHEITMGILTLLEGREPARLAGKGDFYTLLWLSRLLTGVGAVACASTLWLPFALRRSMAAGRGSWWRAAVLTAVAVLAWVAVGWYVPHAFPELPFAFGFYGWPAEVAFGLGAVLGCVTAWACGYLILAAYWPRSRAHRRLPGWRFSSLLAQETGVEPGQEKDTDVIDRR